MMKGVKVDLSIFKALFDIDNHPNHRKKKEKKWAGLNKCHLSPFTKNLLMGMLYTSD